MSKRSKKRKQQERHAAYHASTRDSTKPYTLPDVGRNGALVVPGDMSNWPLTEDDEEYLAQLWAQNRVIVVPSAYKPSVVF